MCVCVYGREEQIVKSGDCNAEIDAWIVDISSKENSNIVYPIRVESRVGV